MSARSCGKIYHVEYNRPHVAGKCDDDGGELYQRDDDKPDTVRNRLYVYYKQTAPIVGYYYAKGLLGEIDGAQPIESVKATCGLSCASEVWQGLAYRRSLGSSVGGMRPCESGGSSAGLSGRSS